MNAIRIFLLSQAFIVLTLTIANFSQFIWKYWLLKDWILSAVQINVSLAILTGAICKSPKCSITLTILIAFVGIATIVYSVWFYFNHKSRVTVVESKRMDAIVGPTWLTSEMEQIQQRLDCCGKHSHEDYRIPLPFSCCRKIVTIRINDDDEGTHCSEYAEEGCLPLLAHEKTTFEFWKMWFYVADGLTAFECAILFAINYCYLKSE